MHSSEGGGNKDFKDVSLYMGVALILSSGLKSIFPKMSKYTNEDR